MNLQISIRQIEMFYTALNITSNRTSPLPKIIYSGMA